MASENRSWSLAELRYAIWLGYGGRSPEHPSISRFASATGVSARTVGRWLSGASRPDPLRAQTIRAALAPPAQVLSRQERERRATVVAAKELARSRPTMATRPWRKAGWDQPHACWLLHHEHLGIERVMVTKARPVHGTDIPSGWTLVDLVTAPNRPQAVLTKHTVLDQIGPWRVGVRAGLVEDGRHEIWLDSAPAVTLTHPAA